MVLGQIKTVQLTERFAEAQRELNRSQERAKELQLKIDALTIENHQAAERVSSFLLHLYGFLSLIINIFRSWLDR